MVRNCQCPVLLSVLDEITVETGVDMIVDCDRCVVRGHACQECVITVLLGAPPGGLELDGTDRRALDTLAAAGMVPRLQLVERDADHINNRGEARRIEAGTDTGCKRVKRSSRTVERSDRQAI
jgi:hypothetical protein